MLTDSEAHALTYRIALNGRPLCREGKHFTYSLRDCFCVVRLFRAIRHTTILEIHHNHLFGDLGKFL